STAALSEREEERPTRPGHSRRSPTRRTCCPGAHDRGTWRVSARGTVDARAEAPRGDWSPREPRSPRFGRAARRAAEDHEHPEENLEEAAGVVGEPGGAGSAVELGGEPEGRDHGEYEGISQRIRRYASRRPLRYTTAKRSITSGAFGSGSRPMRSHSETMERQDIGRQGASVRSSSPPSLA